MLLIIISIALLQQAIHHCRRRRANAGNSGGGIKLRGRRWGALSFSGALYVMACFTENEGIKKMKKRYKPKAGQYQLEGDIKQFCKWGETAVTKELNQFNEYQVFKPQHMNNLSEEEKKTALLLHIHLKEKKSRYIKSRSCKNGNPQREHVAKEEAAGPTMALELVFITSTIDAKESEMWSQHIPVAFLHADNKDNIIMKM
jgi:hypothetical protein